MRLLMTIVVTVVLLLLTMAAVCALYLRSDAFDIAATAEHGPMTDRLFRTVRRHAVTRGAGGVETPERVPLEGGTLTATVLAYDDMCAMCHAPPGRGATVFARGMNPTPPDLARAAERRSPEQLFWVIKNGIRMTGMPAWGVTHADDDLWRLVALVQGFPAMSGEDYERLLAEARAAGTEHRH